MFHSKSSLRRLGRISDHSVKAASVYPLLFVSVYVSLRTPFGCEYVLRAYLPFLGGALLNH